MPKSKGSSGEPAMRRAGRKKVVVWLDRNEAELIEAAAARVDARVSTWIRQKAYHAAQKSAEDARRRARE